MFSLKYFVFVCDSLRDLVLWSWRYFCFVHSPNALVRYTRMPGLGVGGARLLAEPLDLGRLAALARRGFLLAR